MINLPRGWVDASIAQVALVNPPSGTNLPADAPVSFVPMAAVEAETGRIDTSETRPFGQVKAKSYRPFAEGDVLFAKITPCMENGKAAIARNLCGGRGFGSTEFHVLRPASGINPDYILHYLLQQSVRRDAARNMKGTAGQLRVPTDYLKEHRIPVPPTGEQERIVGAVEEHLSRLDAAVAALESAQVKLRRMSRAVLWSTFKDTWKTKPLVEVTDSQRPICYGILKPKTTGMLVVPYVEVRSIKNGRIEAATLPRTTRALHMEFQRSELRSGDVLLAIRGSWDRAAVVPPELEGANVSRDVARIAPSELLDPAFLAYYLVSPRAGTFFAGAARGVGVRGVNIGDLRKMPVPTPSPSEQREAVSDIERSLSLVGSLEAEINAALRRSRSLRASVLGAAFAGGLVTQDPKDEPASVLLDRIAAEASNHKLTTARQRRRKVTA